MLTLDSPGMLLPQRGQSVVVSRLHLHQGSLMVLSHVLNLRPRFIQLTDTVKINKKQINIPFSHLLLLFESQLLQLALLLGLQALGLSHVLRPQPLLQRSELPPLPSPQTLQLSLKTTLQFLLLPLQLLPVCNTESWNTTTGL